jgi:Icc-related predicted phosphoesterase
MKGALRILGLADLHDSVEMLEQLRGKKADLIAFCGDLHNASSRDAALPAARALAGLGLPVLIVPGNMDHKDVVPDLWREEGYMMLHRSALLRGDCGFLGMGGMVARDPRRLGDPARYYHSEEEIYSVLAKAFEDIIDAKIKIVITHQPPREAQDTLYSGQSSGSLGLRRFLEEYQPHLLLCGHIHEDRGECRIGSSRIVNVGELRRGFAALIEVDDEQIDVNWIEL